MTVLLKIARLVGIILIFAVLLIDSAAAEPTKVWDLGNFTQVGQITLFDTPMGASTTGKPLELGDFNGDGCGDAALTGQDARGGNGQVHVVFGLCSLWGSVFDLDNLQANDPPMLRIYGTEAGDMLGTEVFHADFNDDGFDDLLIGAQNATNILQQMGGAGAAYIVFGREDLSSLGTIDMNVPPDNVMAIFGEYFEGRLGIWVDGGDFDGDGIEDVLLGANQEDGIEGRRPNAGGVYILYGAPDMLAKYGNQVDMSQPPADVTSILGADYDDLLGSTAYGADLNMDGLDDVIASAALWRGSAGVGGLATGGADGPANKRYNAGDTYIIYGSTTLRGATLDLQTMLDEDGAPKNKRLTVVYGAQQNDFMGEEVAVGDLNADGLNDLVVASLAGGGRTNSQPELGEAWVIYNEDGLEGKMIDLSNDGAAVPIYGVEADSKLGDTILIADMDQDGINDMLVAMPCTTPRGADNRLRNGAGVLAIIFGVEGGLPTTDGLIDLAHPPDDLRYIYLIGADPFDMSSYGMALGDLDEDGFIDIAMNGMNGDGPDNRRPDAGEAYIISGQVFADFISGKVMAVTPNVQVTPEASLTPLETPTPMPTPDQNAVPVSLEEAQQLFVHNCAGCHGEDGEGINGLAVSLAGSPYFASDGLTNAEILAFIRVGRTGDASDSKMGRPMPPSGGNPALTDSEILGMIEYIRTLQ